MLRSCTAAAIALVAVASLPVRALESDIEIRNDVVYGHKMGMALTFDVVKPAEANGAAILFMVSGGWVSRWFDVQQAVASNSFLGPFGALAERGYTVFFIRHGSSPLFKVPDAVDDVKRAVRYIRAHADDFGIDAERMGVFGGSAGGHLSLMIGNDANAGDAEATDPLARVSDRVAAVVAYFPPVDLRQIVGPSDRFPALDFDPEKADDVSPLLFVSADDPPTLLIHGDADQLVPLSNSERILAAFREQKVETELIVIEGGGHGFRGEQQEQAGKALVEWFDAHLGNQQVTATSSH